MKTPFRQLGYITAPALSIFLAAQVLAATAPCQSSKVRTTVKPELMPSDTTGCTSDCSGGSCKQISQLSGPIYWCRPVKDAGKGCREIDKWAYARPGRCATSPSYFQGQPCVCLDPAHPQPSWTWQYVKSAEDCTPAS
jgi:hypothetical protein